MGDSGLKIDLNSDLGEGYGQWSLGPDAELMNIISSANVACGFHAGDPLIIEHTIELAKSRGVAVGAHPGFPDRVGFGRRMIQASFDEIRTDVIYQLGAMDAFCRKAGVELHHVKAHGALYNLAVHDATTAKAIAAAVKSFNPELLFFVLPGSELEVAGESAGLRLAREAFADRAYMPDGSLVSRTRPDSVITDPNIAADRMVRLIKTGKLEAVDGSDINIQADTICLHSDTPSSLTIAEIISTRLREENILIEQLDGRK